MIDYYYLVALILSGVVGLCVGSFLNVVIYRVPNHMSLATPPSHCPKCGYQLRWYDNIPVISYLTLGGKCRSCKEPISFRYTAVEILNTVLWLGCTALFWKTSIPYAICAMAIVSVMLCIFFIDLETMEIPDRFQLILIAIGIALTFFDVFGIGTDVAWYSHLIGAFAAGIVFWLVSYVGEKVMDQPSLGGGDIKLAFASGLILGWERFLLGILIASLSASIVLLALRKKKNDEADATYPFAPFITTGMVIALFFGTYILDWYLGLILVA